MKIPNCKDFTYLKSMVEYGKIDETLDILLSIKDIFPIPLKEKFDQTYQKYANLRRDDARGVVSREAYNLDHNQTISNVIDIIHSLELEYTQEHYVALFEFSDLFRKGNEYFKDEKWKESLECFRVAKDLKVPKPDSVWVELETKLLLNEAQIILGKHKKITDSINRKFDSIRNKDISGIFDLEKVQTNKFFKLVIPNYSSIKFKPLVRGTYKSKVINRIYKIFKVPVSERTKLIIREGLTLDVFEKEIKDSSTQINILKEWGYSEIEKAGTLSLNGLPRLSYQFLENDIDPEKCGNCLDGFINCKTCNTTGKEECYECEGAGTVECENCFGSVKITCRECDGNKIVEIPCDNCQGVSGRPNCGDCWGTGWVTNECKYCAGIGKITCPECTKGKVHCIKCGSDGKLDCIECKGNGKIECEICKGKGEVYTIRLIETKIIDYTKRFLSELDLETKKIRELNGKVSQELSILTGYESSDLEVRSYLKTDGYSIEFDVEPIQKLVCNHYRQLTNTLSQSEYSMIIEEKVKYSLLPCFNIKYSFVYDSENDSNLHITLHGKDKFKMVFGKVPDFSKLSSSSNLKTRLGRAFSTKEQLVTDDQFKKAILLIHVINIKGTKDFSVKEAIAELLKDSFKKFTAPNQEILIKKIREGESSKPNVNFYRFSSRERGIKAFNEILQIIGLNTEPEKLSEELQEIKTYVFLYSPPKIPYIINFLKEFTISIPILLILLAVVIWFYSLFLG